MRLLTNNQYKKIIATEREKWIRICNEYSKWMSAEFPEIGIVMTSLKAEATGEILSCSRPPTHDGPFDVGTLRERLRQLKAKRDARLNQ